MTKEKPLNEKRKELYYELKEVLTTEEEEMLLISVFDFIKQQDAEVVERLKEEIKEKLEHHYKQLKIAENMFDKGAVVGYSFINEEIDKIMGEFK